jgi:protease-4
LECQTKQTTDEKMSFQLIRAVLSEPWMLDASEANQYLPLLSNLLGGNNAFGQYQDKDLVFEANGAVMAGGDSITIGTRQEGYTAILPITGPILKYTAECGPRGMDYYGSMLMMAENDPNINSVLLVIDSGGGQAFGTQSFAKLIKSMSKPTLAIINDGVGASAAYWIASAASEGIWATTATSVVGSIGTMVTIADFRQKMEKDGIILHEIYADASTNKNKDFKDAIDGKYEPIKASLLNPINEAFMDSVRASRGSKITNEEVLTGKTYMAAEAVTLGLIDQIGSIQEAVNYLQGQVKSKSINQSIHQPIQQEMKFKLGLTAILMALGFGAVASEEESPLVTEERLAALNASLETANQAAQTAQAEVARLQGELASAKASETSLTADRDAWKAKADAFAKGPGASHFVPNAGNPEGGSTDPDQSAIIAGLAHNAALDSNPLFN